MNLLWQPKLCNLRQLKIAVFTYRSPHFCFPWGRPWGNHAKCCMDGKKIRCLQIVSPHVPIYLQQFPSYSSRKCKKSPFSRTAAHIFVFPWDAPATITQYVGFPQIGEYNTFVTFVVLYFFSVTRPDRTVALILTLGVTTMGDVIWGEYAPQTSQGPRI